MKVIMTSQSSAQSSAQSSSQSSSQLSRRLLLKWIGGAGAGLMLAGGCTDSGSSQSTVVQTPLVSAQESDLVDAPIPPLRVVFPNEPRQFDPARMTSVEAYHLAYAIYDALIWIDEELIPQPLLAASWQVTPDQLTWTFELQRDMVFHNGAEFTAKDVVYTFERLIDPNFGSTIYEVLRIIERIEAVDDYTVRFVLSAANADFPVLLAAPQAGIVPNQTSTLDLTQNPVGAGPFRFVEYIPGDRVRMQRHLGYPYADGYSIDELEYVYVQSLTAQTDALLAGDVDLIPEINPLDIPKLASDPELTILEVPSGRYQTIVMQANEAPFTDLRVRQALKHCADRPLLLEEVLQGHGETGRDHPLSSLSPFYADLPLPEYNIEKARRLLAEAGYPDGLSLSLVTAASRPGMVELAERFRETARPAGVLVDVIKVPADVYWSDYAGKVPFHIGSWNGRPSVDEAFTVPYHSMSKHNESKWKNLDFDTLIEAARAEADEEKRKALYERAQMILMQDGAVIIPYFRSALFAIRNTIQNFEAHPLGWIDFHEVSFNPSV